MGLYQDLKADSSCRSGAGDTVHSVHRRNSPDSRNQGESQRSSVGSEIPTTVPRFHCKHGKDGTGSVSMPRISGFHGRYYQDGTEPSSPKKKIWAESQQILEAELVTARTLSRLIGEMNATNQVIPPAPLFYRSLQMDLTMALRRADQDYATSQSIPRQSGGTDLVGHPNDKMEWQDSISNGARPDHRIRRFIPRVGSILPRHQHRGTLVSSGEEVAHQLPRTASSDSSTKNLCEEHEGTISIVEDRQHNSSCLHQQPRGNYYIQGFDSSNQRSVDVVSREEKSHPSGGYKTRNKKQRNEKRK